MDLLLGDGRPWKRSTRRRALPRGRRRPRGPVRLQPGRPALAHQLQEEPVQALVGAELGVEGDREHRPLPGRHRVTRRARRAPPPRAVLGDPGGADEDRPQRRRRGYRATSRSASKLRIWRPKALRSARMSISAEVVAVEHDQPGAGAEHRGARRRRARAAARPAPRARSRASSWWTPAGDHEPVEAARGRRARAPRGCPRRGAASIRAWASKPPCSASTPISGGPPGLRGAATSRAGPAAARPRASSSRGSPSASRDRARRGDALGVLPVGGGLDDRPRPRGRVLGLEDARADEHAFGAERHHQRGVGRGGDPAGAEEHYRQAPRAATSRTRSSGAPSSLAAVGSSSSRASSGGGSRR